MLKNIDRDEAILAHIGLYRITLRPVLSRLFLAGRTPGNVLQRLIAEGRVQTRAGLPGHLRYYQLTAGEALRRGLPVGRAKPFRPQALQTHLGILWYCCMSPTVHRRRLEPPELQRLFGTDGPSGPHVLESGPPPRVIRVHVTGADARSRSAVKAVARRVLRLSQDPLVGAWIRNRQYAFAILADGSARRARIQELLTRHVITNRTQVDVEYAPSLRTAGDALRLAKPGPGAAAGPSRRTG